MEHKHQGISARPTFTQFIRIAFSLNHGTEKSAVQVYISPSLFTTVKENTKYISELSYYTSNTTKSDLHLQC
jgi:hypothetical protein